jgi:hypothetical protein
VIEGVFWAYAYSPSGFSFSQAWAQFDALHSGVNDEAAVACAYAMVGASWVATSLPCSDRVHYSYRWIKKGRPGAKGRGE